MSYVPTHICNQLRSLDEWLDLNPVLCRGEIGIVEIAEDEIRLKVGNGKNKFDELPYAGISPMINKKLFFDRIKLRYDTWVNWETANPKLLQGEVALVQCENGVKIKIGNGTDRFRDLDYFADGSYEDLNKRIKHLELQSIFLYIIIIIMMTIQICFM